MPPPPLNHYSYVCLNVVCLNVALSAKYLFAVCYQYCALKEEFVNEAKAFSPLSPIRVQHIFSTNYVLNYFMTVDQLRI